MKISWSQERSKALAKDILFFVAGSLVYAVSVKMFTAPNQIASGGVTGLSIVLNYLFHTPDRYDCFPHQYPDIPLGGYGNWL